jgi:peptide deformylase
VAVLGIRLFGDPVLRQRARPVERPTELHRGLARNMLETMRAAPGVGLAGPQVGVLERIFVWEVEERSGTVIDPVIARRSEDTIAEEEGCLSVPGLLYPVERAVSVTVTGIDEDGEPVSVDAEGLLARVFQHEVDHLDGILFIDRLPPDLRQDAKRVLREQMLGVEPATAGTGHPRETL